MALHNYGFSGCVNIADCLFASIRKLICCNTFFAEVNFTIQDKIKNLITTTF
jgi:hypothetical protein